MHMMIYALVEESTHDDALATGKSVFNRLVGADPHPSAVFDYYVTFDEEDTSVAGKARWGELPTAAPVDSDDGQDLLERGWEATKEEFERNLDRVKETIDELSDEDIMRDEDIARHAFHQVGTYDGVGHGGPTEASDRITAEIHAFVDGPTTLVPEDSV